MIGLESLRRDGLPTRRLHSGLLWALISGAEPDIMTILDRGILCHPLMFTMRPQVLTEQTDLKNSATLLFPC